MQLYLSIWSTISWITGGLAMQSLSETETLPVVIPDETKSTDTADMTTPNTIHKPIQFPTMFSTVMVLRYTVCHNSPIDTQVQGIE